MKRNLFVTALALLMTSWAVGQNKGLDFYVKMASQNSQALADLQSQRQSLGPDSALLRATYGLQVTADVNLMYAPVIHHWGYDNVLTNGQNIMGVFTVKKQIIGADNLNARLQQYSIAGRQLARQSELSKKELEQIVTQQYLQAYQDLQQYYLAREITGFLKVQDQILLKLTKAASFKQTDYLLFKVALQTQMLAEQKTRGQFLKDLGTLNYQCGIVDTSWTALAPPQFEAGGSVAFEQSIYYQKSLEDSVAINNAAQIIRLNYKPVIRVFADGGYASSLTYQSQRNFGASIGLSYSLPIYDGHQKKQALLNSDIAAERHTSRTSLLHRQYEQKYRQLNQQLQICQGQIEGANRRLVFAKTLIDAGKKELSGGDMPVTDFLMAINNYLNLKSALIQNQVDRLLTLYQMQNIVLP